MANVSNIRNEIFKNSEARRIVIKVQIKNPDSQEIRKSAHSFVDEIFPGWEQDDRILFLAIEAWGDRTFIAVDINHFGYNFDTAHKSTDVLPVFVLSKKRESWNLVRCPKEDESLAARLAYLHNANGFDKTPFLENHNSRVVHANPRVLSA